MVLCLALLGASLAATAEEAPADVAARPSAATAPGPLIPAAVFATPSRYRAPILSPRGQQVLARTTVDGRERVLVQNLGSGAANLLPMPEKAEVQWYRWAGERRVLLSVAWPERVGAEEVLGTRLFVIDLATRTAHVLADKDTGPEGDDLVHVDPDGDWVLLSQQKSIYEFPSVFRYELTTGKRTVVIKPQDRVWEWYADRSGVVRAGIGFFRKSWFMLYRPREDVPFKRIGTVDYDDEVAALSVLGLVRESDEGYVLSNARTGRYALHRFNYATQTLGEVLFEDAAHDIDDYFLDLDGRDVVAVTYVDDRPRVKWLEPQWAAHQAELERLLPGKDVYIVSRDDEGKRLVVWIGEGIEPGEYHLFEVASKKLHLLARVNEQLRAAQLAATRYERYMARDGLEIPAYVTLPPGREPRQLPLIVVPHGGPYGVRDELGFDPLVQFLANRGYAVLQPNYRGSGGYGRGFREKGNGEYGRAMQNDLDDGVDWLVKAGIADAGRVCIVGVSYGGYAALWAVTRNPERYQCAASLAGVTDVKRQFRYTSALIAPRDRGDWEEMMVGKNAADLATVSPLGAVARLTRPVLVAHGEADQRVPFKQSALYRAALSKAGKPHEFVAYPAEGHGLDNPANLRDWFERLDAFLTKNLAPSRAAVP
jgi:dipeptidyl aminopeptidase/acylaminoacyl peptidase